MERNRLPIGKYIDSLCVTVEISVQSLLHVSWPVLPLQLNMCLCLYFVLVSHPMTWNCAGLVVTWQAWKLYGCLVVTCVLNTL